MNVHNIAFSSIAYANAENIRLQSVNTAAAESMGLSPQELSTISKNPENRGSIAFTKLNAETSSLYYGGGEELGQAVQTTDKINQYSLMQLPDSVSHDATGPKIIVDGRRRALNDQILREDVKYHDWMKEYAQNIKDTSPEGAALPKGTQELLDAPSTDQMVAAARARLSEIGDTGAYEGLRISSMQTSEHFEAGQVYKYNYLENGIEEEKLFKAEGLAPHIEKAKKDIPFSGNSFTKKIGFGAEARITGTNFIDNGPGGNVPPVNNNLINQTTTAADRGMFQVGNSARGSVDNSLVAQVNNALSESGLDTRTFSFTSKSDSGAVRTLGSVSDLTKDMMGVISTNSVANQMHPNALQGKFAGSAMNLAEHGVDLTKFFKFSTDEGIDFKDGVKPHKLNTLLFDDANFNRGELTRSGFDSALKQQIRPLQTTFHEIGHVASRLSGSDQGVTDSRNAFQPIGDRISRLTAGSAELPNLSLEYESSFIKMITQNALEEARAETFSYAMLPKTQVGQDYLSHLKSVDFTTNIANGDFLSKEIRGNSFAGTGYYHFNERSNNSFQAYSTMDDNWNRHLTSLGIDVDDLTKRAHITAAGNIIGAVDFGEFSEAYDPLRQGLIEKNRNYILNTHGQEYADMYDEAVRSGTGQRFGVSMTGDAIPSATGAISAPTVDDADVSAKVTSNEPLKEPPPTRRGPGDLGKSADDIRKRPTPKGTDAASAKITPDGTIKPPAPQVTPNNTPVTSAVTQPTTQAQVTSNAVTKTDDAINSVTTVKRVTQKGRGILDDGMETARKLASGNARTMGIAGAAALLGAGALSMRNRSKEDIQTRLDRQRYGEIR